MLPARPAPDNADSQFLRGVTTQTAHHQPAVRYHFPIARLAGHRHRWHAATPGSRPSGFARLRAAELSLRKLSTYNALRVRQPFSQHPDDRPAGPGLSSASG
jgi:hypothetical protein